MTEWKWWVALDATAVLLFAAALVAYVRGLPPSVPLGITLTGLLVSRITAFAFVIGVFNVGIALVGRVSRTASLPSALLALVAGVAVLGVAAAGLWIVMLFSFPQY